MNTAYPHHLAGVDQVDAPAEPTPEQVAEGRRIRALLATAGRDLELDELAGELFAARPWRLAGALDEFRAEANRHNPNRDRASDGTIGDAAHMARDSDHNVDANGLVCGLDLDVDGLPIAAAFERVRQLVYAGQLPQFRDGYLILNGRITLPDWSGWVAYHGTNPHTSHGHASCSHRLTLADVRAGLAGIFAGPPAPTQPAPGGFTGPDLTGSGTGLRGKHGNNGPRVRDLQGDLLRIVPAYARDGLGPAGADGWYGDRTAGVLAELARRSGFASDGRDLGPKTAAALWRLGVRV